MRIGWKEEPVHKLLWNYKRLWGATGKELEDSGSRISGPLKRGNNATYTVVDSAKVAPLKGTPAQCEHCNKNLRGNLTLHSPEWPGTVEAGAEQQKPGSVCIAAMRKNIEQWSSFGKPFRSLSKTQPLGWGEAQQGRASYSCREASSVPSSYAGWLTTV